jgi:hypothetical protein
MVNALIAHPFNSGEATALLLVGASLAAATILGLTGIVFGVLHSMAQHRAEASLKREMIQRGIPTDEIVRIINTRSSGPIHVEAATDLPFACEAVVADEDGDWRAALVLQAAQGRFLVHYVGEDMSENEWVGENRIRFAAGSQLAHLVSHMAPGRNGIPEKEPAEAEL